MPNSTQDQVDVLLVLGEWHLARGRPVEAMPLFEQALNLTRYPTHRRAEAQALLARALWDSGAGRERARELASQAHAHYQRLGHPSRLARMAQWLSTHPLP